MTFRYSIVIVFVLVVTSLSCDGGSSEVPARFDSYEVHPKEANIPFEDNQHIAVNKDTELNQEADIPASLKLLYEYLSADDAAENKIEVDVNIQSRMTPGSVSDNRLILADQGASQVYEFNISEDRVAVLAREGQGPGDVNLPTDLSSRDDTLYISSRDHRISIFECSSDCSFVREVSLDNAPFAVERASNGIGVVSMPNRDQIEGAPAVHLFNDDGELKEAIGKAYRTEHPIVLEQFLMESTLLYSQERDMKVLSFERIPIIYIYSDGSLHSTYKIEEFSKNMVLSEEPNQITLKPHSSSSIQNMGLIDETFVWVRVRTSYLQNPGEDDFPDYESSVSYYVLNLETMSSNYIGSQHEDHQYTALVDVTEYGLLIQEPRSLYFLPLN